MKKRWRYVGLTVVLTIVFAVGFGVFLSGDVFGRFVAKKPYVNQVTEDGATKGDPIPNGFTADLVSLTPEGGNQKGTLGSGMEPCSKEVPPAKKDAVKGTADNPFVILEVVPDLAQQQLIYLNTDNPQYPLNIQKIGIDACNAKTAGSLDSFVNNRDPYFYNLHGIVGEWFSNYNYEVFKVGAGTEREKMKLAEIDKLYSVVLTKEDVEADVFDYKFQDFEQDYQAYNSIDQNQKTQKSEKLAQIIKKYGKLFVKDETGAVITDLAKADGRNWEIKRKEKGGIHYEVSFSSEDVKSINKWSIDVRSTIDQNPAVFEKDSTGNEISDKVRKDTANWTGEHTGTTSYDYTVKTREISDEDYGAYQSGNKSVNDLIRSYPAVFKKDANGKKIEESRLKMPEWTVERKESRFVNPMDAGYLHYVEKGGNYNLKMEWWLPETGASAVVLDPVQDGEWEYVQEIPEGAKKGDPAFAWRDQKDPSVYWSMEDIAKINNNAAQVVTLEKGYEYTFQYKKDVDNFLFSYDAGDKTVTYTFHYYGLKGNDILKRSLFTFQDQKECDEFVMQVIAMTPEQINAVAQKDDETKLDLIERADMFYFGAYTEKTNNIGNVYETYYRYIKGDSDYSFPKEGVELETFADHDLEWDLVYKILKRLGENEHLPLIMTQNLGSLIQEGVVPGSDETDTHMYVTPLTENGISKHRDWTGCLNNVAKLYLCTVQFDMLARHSDGCQRTFYEDILPRLQTINRNVSEGGTGKEDEKEAVTTGFFQRPYLVGDELAGEQPGDLQGKWWEDEKDKKKNPEAWNVARSNEVACNGHTLGNAEKKSCYYLWNIWTFYPETIKLSSGNQQSAPVSEYVKYGYLKTFFTSNADVFQDGVLDHHIGSDGLDGNNVGIVSGGGSVADTNFSTLLGATESSGVVSTILNVAYHIMNKQTPKVEPLTVTVKKQKRFYQRLSNETVLIDYHSAAKYKSDRTLYVKVTVSNQQNNEAGIIQSIQLLNNDDNKLANDPVPRMDWKDPASAMSKEEIRDINGAAPLVGYRVPAMGSTTFYVPYQLSDWQNGYNTIRFVMRGRKYIQTGDKISSSLGSPTQYDITITERALFDLE